MRRLFGGRATMEAALSKTLWPSRYLWRAFFCVRTRCAQTAAERLDDRVVCRVAWSGDVACDVALTGPPTDAAKNERVAPIDADRVRTTAAGYCGQDIPFGSEPSPLSEMWGQPPTRSLGAGSNVALEDPTQSPMGVTLSG
jgi:hypothetical protein